MVSSWLLFVTTRQIAKALVKNPSKFQWGILRFSISSYDFHRSPLHFTTCVCHTPKGATVKSQCNLILMWQIWKILTRHIRKYHAVLLWWSSLRYILSPSYLFLGFQWCFQVFVPKTSEFTFSSFFYNIVQIVKLWNCSLCSIFQPPLTSSLFGPNIPFSTLPGTLQWLKVCVLPLIMWETREYMVFYPRRQYLHGHHCKKFEFCI